MKAKSPAEIITLVDASLLAAIVFALSIIMIRIGT